MKNILYILLTVYIATLFTACSEIDLPNTKGKLKEFKIIPHKPEGLETYDKIVKRYSWGLITQKDDLLYITDSLGIKLNKKGFKNINKFNEFNITTVQNTESKYGLVNIKGEVIADTIYSKIHKFKPDKLAVIELQIPHQNTSNDSISYSTKKGIISTKGEVRIKPEYFNIGYNDEINIYKVTHHHYREKNPKVSLFSSDLGWIDNASFDQIGKFIEGVAIVHKSGKNGLIDRHGNIVIPTLYRTITGPEEGLLRVFDNKNTAFFDTSGNIIIPFNNYSALPFNNGVSIVHSAKSTISRPRIGLMDKTGIFIKGFEFSKVGPFTFYKDLNKVLAKASPINNLSTGLINTSGEYIFKPMYRDIRPDKQGFFRVTMFNWDKKANSNTKKSFYLVNVDGQVFIDTEQPNPNIKKPDGIDKIGILDLNRKIVSKPIYDNARATYSNTIAVSENGKWGIVNNLNDVIVPIQYQEIEIITPSIALIKENGKWGILNTKNNVLTLPIEYQELKVLSLTQVTAKKNNQWSTINL